MSTSARGRHAGRLVALCCLSVAVTAGCGSPLCPSTTFPAMIHVHLAPDWEPTSDLELTISCPPDLECGFLDGPKTAGAGASVAINNVLRPPEVTVVVRSATSGAVLTRERFHVHYVAHGPRQTDCGGDAEALVLVPAG